MITITIEADTNPEEIALYGQALQAISDLRVQQQATADAERNELLSDLFEKLEGIGKQAEATEPAPPKAKRKTKEPVAETPAPVASPVEVSPPVAEQAEPTPEPVAEAAPAPVAEPVVEMKLEDVRALLTSISRAGKTAEVKALLQEFGKEKLTDIDPKDYAAVVEKAKALQ